MTGEQLRIIIMHSLLAETIATSDGGQFFFSVSSSASGTEAQQEQKKRILEQQKLMAEKKKEALPAIFPRNQPIVLNGLQEGKVQGYVDAEGHIQNLSKPYASRIFVLVYTFHNPS
jgi:hypothetical protein